MHELCIQNGTIVDGTGKPAYQADILVNGGKITAIGHAEGEAAVTVDAAGLTVTPGFIDIHTHADVSAPYYRYMQSSLMQGVTTAVGGHCGYAPAPCDRYWTSQFIEMECLYRFATEPGVIPLLGDPEKMAPLIEERFHTPFDWRTYGEYAARLNRHGLGANLMAFAGHGAIRSQVMGWDYARPATQAETAAMAEYLLEALDAGACGLSIGLDYAPGAYADREELLTLLRCVREHGGIFTSHWRKTGIRDQSAGRQAKLNGIRETLQLALEAGVRLQLSHLSSGFDLYPYSAALDERAAEETLKLVDCYREQGLDVCFDVIPHITGGILYAPDLAMPLLRDLLACGTRQAFSQKLRNEAYRGALLTRILGGAYYDINPLLDPAWDENCVITACAEGSHAGKTLREIARAQRTSSVEMYLKLLAADPYTKAFRPMRGVHPSAIKAFLAHVCASPGTDSFSIDLTTQFPYGADMPLYYPNPNTYNGMLRYLKEYAPTPLTEAIHRLTGLPAAIMRLADRGELSPGKAADILIFDPNALDLNEDMLDPRRYPRGMRHVFVNGVEAVKDGAPTRSLSGRFIKYRQQL